MAGGKYAQRLEHQCPLSCPEKGRPYDMRGISFLPIAYNVLTGVLCERLKPLVKTKLVKFERILFEKRHTIYQLFQKKN